MSTIITCCRSCGAGPLRPVVDLGNQPLANNLLVDPSTFHDESRYPLRLVVCRHCGLMQIDCTVQPSVLFSDYRYFSSYSDTMIRHARAAVDRHVAAFGLGGDSFVVEIASNDGYLLRRCVELGIPCLGIEPAANVAEVARAAGVPTRVEFFGEESARKLAAEGRKADLILGNNVFAHVPDTNDFVAGLAALLAPGGRVVLEFPEGLEMLDHLEFDTIYHEHFFYLTLTPVVALFERHGLEIVDVEPLPIHGGSMRLTAAHRGAHEASPAVQARLDLERRRGVLGEALYEGFGDRVRRICSDLRALVARLKAEGFSVAAYGASAKGSTLLNYAGFTAAEIDFLADRSPHKQGRFSPGLHLPILGPEALVKRRPDYTLLLTWNFADEILAQQAAYRALGGKFIIPVPEVRVT